MLLTDLHELICLSLWHAAFFGSPLSLSGCLKVF